MTEHIYNYCPGCGVEHTVECSESTLCLGCTESKSPPVSDVSTPVSKTLQHLFITDKMIADRRAELREKYKLGSTIKYIELTLDVYNELQARSADGKVWTLSSAWTNTVQADVNELLDEIERLKRKWGRYKHSD